MTHYKQNFNTVNTCSFFAVLLYTVAHGGRTGRVPMPSNDETPRFYYKYNTQHEEREGTYQYYDVLYTIKLTVFIILF